MSSTRNCPLLGKAGHRDNKLANYKTRKPLIHNDGNSRCDKIILPIDSMKDTTKEAGEGSRTPDVQLGKMKGDLNIIRDILKYTSVHASVGADVGVFSLTIVSF